jgi:hypothetical protein
VLGITGLSNPHCHMEGCEWHVTGCSPERPVIGACGLLKLLATATPGHPMTWATLDQVGFACGWLRTPLNVSSTEGARN